MAQRLIKKFPQLHENRFLLGGIAPDAHFSNKEQAHFYTGDYQDFSRRIDYERYWETSKKEDFSYRCGYYVHLIADELWLQGFYKSWLKQAIEGTPSIGERYHEDFRRFNTVLSRQLSVNRAALRQETEKLKKQTDVAQLKQLVDDVEKDTKTLMEQIYDVMPVHQLEGYMASALKICEQALKNKLS